MAEYLFLGGEFHGQMRTAPTNELGLEISAVSAFATPIEGVHDTSHQVDHGLLIGGGRIIQNWYRRDLTAADHVTGVTYRRVCYIHEHWHTPQDMMALLSGHLMLEWAKQGEVVGA